jgi:hypothetical protein
VLTKQDPIDNTLKCNLASDELSKVGLDLNKLVEENMVTMFIPKAFPEQQPKLKSAHVGKKARPKRSRLARITQRLYNLESCNEPEMPLNVELDLYQMEDY